jgi:hypothetical protein
MVGKADQPERVLLGFGVLVLDHARATDVEGAFAFLDVASDLLPAGGGASSYGMGWRATGSEEGDSRLVARSEDHMLRGRSSHLRFDPAVLELQLGIELYRLSAALSIVPLVRQDDFAF